jgi:hypothetical protein
VSALAWLNPAVTRALLGRDAAAPGGDLFTGPDLNSSQARNLRGRPKTDKEDAAWIARLTEMGLLRRSFVPPPEIRAMRVYTRQLVHLTQDRTRYWQLQEDALCKLSSVGPKLAGSQSDLAHP